MPKIEKATPVPGMYSEDLMGDNDENENPWSVLEELANDKPVYTIDDRGIYRYKQADAMNRFQNLVKEAKQTGDNEKADYYESFMRHILENDPISITGEDFDRLSDEGRLNYFRLGKMQARINNDEEGFKQFSQEYDSLAKQLHGGFSTPAVKQTLETKPLDNEAIDDKTLAERVQFHFSDKEARELLVSAMKTTNTPLIWDGLVRKVIYDAFTEELPQDMERKMPKGYLGFGVDFFRKQVPEYDGSPSNLRELFDSDEYKKASSPCMEPQEKGAKQDETMDFIHCFNPNKEGKYGGFGGQENIDCRFYLCPKPDNLIPIMNAFVQKNEEANLPYYFKFGLNPTRNDKLVIYSGGEIAEKQLEILESIQVEHPEWFRGSGKKPLWGSIEGLEGVYYGAQPETNMESYGGKRVRLFCDAMEEWAKENGIKWDKKTVKTEDLSDEQIKRFKKIFADVCRKNNIEPKNFASVR